MMIQKRMPRRSTLPRNTSGIHQPSRCRSWVIEMKADVFASPEEGSTTQAQEPCQNCKMSSVMRSCGDMAISGMWMILWLYPTRNINKWMYQRLTVPSDGFLKVIPFTGCQFANYESSNGVEYGINCRLQLDSYEDCVSTELNKCLRHHTGVHMHDPKLGLKCDDMGWVKIENVLKYERIWRHEWAGNPHVFVVNRGYRGQPDTWNRDEAEFRVRTLMKITSFCARWGRRVREQILAFGIPKTIDRTNQVCVDNNIDDNTEIPEEGLLLYPVAVRAPAGHCRRRNNEVILVDALMSHPLSASTVAHLPGCFHVTQMSNLAQIRMEGLLVPGGNGILSRMLTFFNPYAPWDRRS